MFHFTCLVIGPDPAAQLQPYHEFECTGTDDQYVQEVDRTEEARAEYAKQTKAMVRNDATGELVGAYADQFYRDPTPEEERKHGPFLGTGGRGGLSWSSREWGDGRGYRAKIRDVPEGWTNVDAPMAEHESFREFIEGWYGTEAVLRAGGKRTDEHKHGWIEIDEKGEVTRLVKRTNPAAHWDWYEIGGRWTGFFPLKRRAKGKTGNPGLGTSRARPGTADQCRKGDVDFDRARKEATEEANRNFDAWEDLFTEHGRPEPWSSFYARHEAGALSIEEARRLYHAQPAIAAGDHYDCPVQAYGFDREAYVTRFSNGALVPHAIVKDGKWHERGEMGWFGMVHGEMDEAEWEAQVQRLYDDLPDDTMLTLVDCHI